MIEIGAELSKAEENEDYDTAESLSEESNINQ